MLRARSLTPQARSRSACRMETMHANQSLCQQHKRNRAIMAFHGALHAPHTVLGRVHARAHEGGNSSEEAQAGAPQQEAHSPKGEGAVRHVRLA